MRNKIRNNHKSSIIVAEDDQTTSRLIRYNLEKSGARVSEAQTGLDCIKLLSQAKADLLLLDVGLPDFSGWGILSLLRLTDSTSEMPVIIVSANAPGSGLIERFGPDDYIQKPFDMRDLISRVSKLINSRGVSTTREMLPVPVGIKIRRRVSA
ncbi:MAG: response regulator [Chloroflexi bacterium]|nr:response regulator [Chloroflexota bacterium]